MQLYLDFVPNSLVGGVPPLVADPEDALIIIDPVATNTTSNAFALLIANELNDYWRKNGLGYSVHVREDGKNKEKGHDATIEITSPGLISNIYASGDSLTPPSTEVTASPGISFNPSLGNATQRLTAAFPGTTNAQLRINNQDPNDDPAHQVEVFAPGPLKFTFDSGSNPFQPVTFLLSSFYNPENVPSSFVAFPGSLDIGTFSGGSFQNITVVADSIFGGTGSFLDGFFFTNAQGILDFQVTLGLPQVGNNVGAQGIIADPTIAPVGLSFTQAADINFSVGFEQTLPLGDNGNMSVPFIQGTTFDFFGATYTSVEISANGYVTFGGAPGFPNDSIVDPAVALSLSPAIFANWSDWDTTGVGVQVRQFGAEFKISWGTIPAPISHAGGATDLGAFSLSFFLNVPPGVAPRNQNQAVDGAASVAASAGSIFIDTLLLDDGNIVATFDGLTGVSPGQLPPMGTVTNRNFDNPIFPSLPGQPWLMQADRSGQAPSRLPVASGGPALYNNGRTNEGRSVSFFPTPVTGQASFAAIADDHPIDDLQGADISSILVTSSSMGPINFTLIGYFRYLYSFSNSQSAPTLELVEVGTQNLLATVNILSLMTPNGAQDAGILVAAPMTTAIQPGYRPFEGVHVAIPTNGLTGITPGTSARLKLTLPNGSILLSRDTILLN